MYPSKEKVKELLSTGDFKRIPICKEVLNDELTTIEVMRRLKAKSKHCYMLESASQQEQWGRYSFLGYNPSMEITCTDGNMTISSVCEDESIDVKNIKVTHPGVEIRKIIEQYKSPVMEDMPTFTGGLVGYFSYDYIKYAEPKLELKDHENSDFKDMDLMLFDQVIVFDHYKQKLIVIAGCMGDDVDAGYEKAKNKIDEILDLVRNGEKNKFEPLKVTTEIKPKYNCEEYSEMVNKAKHYIKEGDIFQVVLSNPMTAKASGSLFDTYRVLRAKNPSPYMFYFSSDDIELAGASPETLAKLDNGVAFTFPLAGTRPRGKNKEEDLALEKELLADEKEIAEHNMLVDLGRNDMGRVSKIGSVRVEQYMDILRYSHVMHIGSTVVGNIADDKDAINVIDSILPAGTLSGAPKFRACQIIEELEQSKRGVYGGAIGYIDFTGNLDTCIAIRLVYKKKDDICIRSGAGIVADSVPENEFIECQNKAKAVINAIKEAVGGLE